MLAIRRSRERRGSRLKPSRSRGACEALHFLGEFQTKLMRFVRREPVGQLWKCDLPHARVALGPWHGRRSPRLFEHRDKLQAYPCRVGPALEPGLRLEQGWFGIGLEKIALAVETQAFSLAISTSIWSRQRRTSSRSGSSS
jgi:hypothetical protein